jgi:hypothetical protein
MKDESDERLKISILNFTTMTTVCLNAEGVYLLQLRTVHFIFKIKQQLLAEP